MGAVPSLAGSVGVRRACELLGVSRATWYRARRTRPAARPRPRPPLALRPHEQEEALGVLHSERFVDQAPRAVYATLLEEGRYLASVRTLHRLFLASRGESRDRRAQRRHPNYVRAGTARNRPQATLVVGHHQVEGPHEVDLFPPLRDPGCVQSLRRGLDGRSPRVVTVGRAAHPALLRKPRHPRRPEVGVPQAVPAIQRRSTMRRSQR